MTTEHDPNRGFTTRWPTTFLQRVLPDHERPNAELARLISSLDHGTRDLTTDYLADDLLGMDHPAIVWLRECVNITVRDYFAHLDMRYSLQWSLQGWANVNRFGDYHDCHNHPHAYLSGTYYVQVPARMEKLESRRDVRPGRISFYDPRGAVNMNAIKGDPNIEAEHTVTPKAGMILLWPAFVNHFVHPNLSKQQRVSVSFNVLLKWSDDYLPEQVL